VFASYKHSSLLGLVVSAEGKKFYNIDTSTASYFKHLSTAKSIPYNFQWQKRQQDSNLSLWDDGVSYGILKGEVSLTSSLTGLQSAV
jgi:hypothetical protein